jgi:CTP synthase
VPLNFEKEKLSEKLLGILALPATKEPDLKAWRALVKKIEHPKRELRLAVVGKYFSSGSFVLSDAYVSVIEALKYASFHAGAKPVLDWIDAEEFEKDKKALTRLSKYDGVVVPGGFGTRGIEGIIRVIEYARIKKIPYFGLCYGMQLLVVEYARNVAGLDKAHTVEVDAHTPHPVVDIMPEQKKKLAQGDFGGSMRLGTFPAYLKEGTVARGAYKAEMVHERHRHRYEVNPAYVGQLESRGLIFSGISPDKKLMEIAELPKSVHPFFLGTQFHPEFLARPLTSHPLFDAFVKASLLHQNKR